MTAGDGALLLQMMGRLGVALAVTVVVECVVAALLGLRTARALALMALANLATNPAANVLLASTMALTGARSLTDPIVAAMFVAIEAVVVLAEWRLIAFALPEHRSHAFRVAVAANAASLVAGLLVFGTGPAGV